MLRRRWTLISAAVAATTLNAQSPVTRSASWDVGALASDEVRVNLEPLAFGRVAVHLAVARWTTSANRAYEFEHTALGLNNPRGDSELAVDVAARFYPRALSSAVPEHRFRAYAGVGAGLRHRARAIPAGACRDVCPAILGYDRATGVEPLADVGIRFEPAARLHVDLGLRTRLITFDDPTVRFTRGDVVPHVALALGFGW